MDVDRRIADAIRMARTPHRLHNAPGALLSSAAVLVAKAVVLALEKRGGSKVLRADAMTMLDQAGLAIADEMRRRRRWKQEVHEKEVNRPHRFDGGARDGVRCDATGHQARARIRIFFVVPKSVRCATSSTTC